jgi:hypothetical protein
MTLEYKLVLLETKADYQAEGTALEHAVGHYHEYFQQKEVTVYSLRKGDERILTLSVQPERYTDHIVGLANRQPTLEEFEILAPLLAELNIENRYDPNTLS